MAKRAEMTDGEECKWCGSTIVKDGRHWVRADIAGTEYHYCYLGGSIDAWRPHKPHAKRPADASPSGPQEQEKRPDAFDWWWNYARPFPESTTDGDMARAAWVAGRAALIAEMDKIHAGIKEAENCDDK